MFWAFMRYIKEKGWYTKPYKREDFILEVDASLFYTRIMAEQTLVVHYRQAMILGMMYGGFDKVFDTSVVPNEEMARDMASEFTNRIFNSDPRLNPENVQGTIETLGREGQRGINHDILRTNTDIEVIVPTNEARTDGNTRNTDAQEPNERKEATVDLVSIPIKQEIEEDILEEPDKRKAPEASGSIPNTPAKKGRRGRAART